MTEADRMLAEIQSNIATLPQSSKDGIETIAKAIRGFVSNYPGHAHMAIALVGAELAAEPDEEDGADHA